MERRKDAKAEGKVAEAEERCQSGRSGGMSVEMGGTSMGGNVGDVALQVGKWTRFKRVLGVEVHNCILSIVKFCGK